MIAKFKTLPIEDEEAISNLITNVIGTFNIYNLDGSKILENTFLKMLKEDYIKNIFDLSRIKNKVKYMNTSNIGKKFAEKFLKLNESGKMKYMLLLFQELKDNKEILQSILNKFSNFVHFNKKIENLDNTIINLISKNEKLKHILLDIMFIGVEKDSPSFNAFDLHKTIEYLYHQKLISNDSIFGANGLANMKEEYIDFIVNNIDAKNVHNLVSYAGIKDSYNNKYSSMFSLDITEVYEKLKQDENYSNLFKIINQLNGKIINLSEDEVKFFIYLIYTSRVNEIYYQPTTHALCKESTISNILSIAISQNNLKDIFNIFELFKKIESNNISALKDSMNFVLAYYDKEIFRELSNKNINLTNTELIQKIIYLSRNSALNEIVNLAQLNEIKMEDFSNMTIDINKSNGEMQDVRYHPFEKDAARKDRSIFVVESNGNVFRKYVNGHSSGLYEIYGISSYDYLKHISLCVNEKDDVIILSADEFIEIFFNKKITKEQLNGIYETIGSIKDLATYIVGVCSDDLSVNSLNGNDEAMDYNSVINLLNQIAMFKGENEEQIIH